MGVGDAIEERVDVPLAHAAKTGDGDGDLGILFGEGHFVGFGLESW